MKKAVILDKRKAGLVEVADPEPIENWVVVKIRSAAMCTEYKLFESGERTDVLGHEAAGEVVAIAQPGPLKAGDRVVAMPLVGCGVCSLCAGGDQRPLPGRPCHRCRIDTLQGRTRQRAGSCRGVRTP